MATNIVDANGVPISVGSLVKVNAVVTAINALGGHYNEVELQFTYPGIMNPDLNLGHDFSVADGTSSTPGIFRRNIYSVPTRISPSMLLVGS